jgi:cytochrome c-type biogenesis protein CcmH/NrfF
VRRLALALAVLALGAAPAAAAEPRTSLPDVEDEVMCVTCNVPLNIAESPQASRQRALIRRLIDDGQTKAQIKDRLVAEYGQAILAAPPREGLGLLAWWLPIVAVIGAAAIMGAAAWRWSRLREREPDGGRLDPALEARLDDELARWDS